MAKNIDFMGATFPDVPSIRLPQHEGGLVSFDDTTDATATADKILQGYTAYANGQKLTGTASGGITPSGTIQITQNGQVDVTQYAIADVNVSGGGSASNIVHGEFTPNTQSSNEPLTVNIDYSGNGYPLAAYIFVKGGVYKTGSAWYSLIQNGAIGLWIMCKDDFATAPDYVSTTDTKNKAAVIELYKNSSSSSTGYTRSHTMNATTLQDATPRSGVGSVVFFKDKNTMRILMSASSSGFANGITYEYIVLYSE